MDTRQTFASAKIAAAPAHAVKNRRWGHPPRPSDGGRSKRIHPECVDVTEPIDHVPERVTRHGFNVRFFDNALFAKTPLKFTKCFVSNKSVAHEPRPP